MSIPDFFLCDVCGARVPKALRLNVVTDRYHDGVENVNDGGDVDLCHDHMQAYLKSELRPNGQPDYEAGKSLLKWIKCQK